MGKKPTCPNCGSKGRQIRHKIPSGMDPDIMARKVCDDCGWSWDEKRFSDHLHLAPYAVVRNTPRGVTWAVSYHSVSRHWTPKTAKTEAARLNGEADWDDDQGRSMWSGYRYWTVPSGELSDLAAGNIPSPDSVSLD